MATFTQIGSAVVVGSGGAATIDFTSIPSTYTDLLIKLSVRGEVSAVQIVNRIKINSLTSGYADKYLYGSGSAAGSGSFSAVIGFIGDANAATSTANTFSNQEVYIPNYAGTSAKSYSVDSVQETNATTAFSELTAGFNSTTSAITTISFSLASGNIAEHSTAYLYGVSNA
jgi:hypothetical protein